MKIRSGWNELGRSVEDRPIRAYSNFDSEEPHSIPWTFILGGTHGDERATVPFLEAFVSTHLEKGEDLERRGDFKTRTSLGPVMVLPLLNPDGYARDSRYNARGVDLNRNLPELWRPQGDEPPGLAPLSEPECRLLHDVLTLGKPARILSLHWALGEIDPDGDRSYPWAKSLWESLEAPHRSLFRLRKPGDAASMLPGSLGSFCRLRLRESALLVTLELPYHPEPAADTLPDHHFASVCALWKADRERYWNGVYPAVESLLRFAVGTSAEN